MDPTDCHRSIKTLFADQIEIPLYDGTGQYHCICAIGTYLEDGVPASNHTINSALHQGELTHGIDGVPHPLNQANAAEDQNIARQIDISEAILGASTIPGQPGELHEDEPANEVDDLFDLSKPLNEPQDLALAVSGQFGTPEQPDAFDFSFGQFDVNLPQQPGALYPPAELQAWDLLSEALVSPLACNKRCTGNLIGPHECTRDNGGLSVTCLTNNCRNRFITKNGFNGFNRHCKSVHKLGSLIDCEFSGCERVGRRGFSRRDNMLQHMKEMHEGEGPVKRVRRMAHD